MKSLSTPTGPDTQVHVHMTSRSQGSECSFECTEISRPKPPSTEFLHLVAKVSNCDSHEPVQPLRASDEPNSRREHRGVPTAGLGNHEPTSYHLWSHSRRENLCRDVGSGKVMDEMVSQDLRQQRQARASESTGISGKGVWISTRRAMAWCL